MERRESPSTEKVTRRGMLASAGALAALMLAKASERIAQAANGDPLTLGTNNTASNATVLQASGGGSSGALFISNSNGAGLFAEAPGYEALHASSSSDNGLFAKSQDKAGAVGYSRSFIGVRGISDGSSGAGMLGENGRIGVLGIARDEAGVSGESTGRGVGVKATSADGVALYARGPAGGTAGQFDGNLVVNGSFSATGIKSAVVPQPDGSFKRLYCQESPEPWFEDFGEAPLIAGRALVRLDPEFATVAQTDTYHVFLSEYEDNQGLFVTGRTPTGFEVRAKAGPNAAGVFSYRVVAKRKDAASAPRLERVTLPQRPPETPDHLRRAPRPNLDDVRPPGVPRPAVRH